MLCIRPMCQEDIAQVTEIDREAFFTQWPTPDYQRELKKPLAHHIIASDDAVTGAVSRTKPAAKKGLPGFAIRLTRFFNRRFRSGGSSPPASRHILGFAGFWMLADEAHITSIAVRKLHHRRGIGELLILCLIDLAIEHSASAVHLEVRASNTAAQELYLKFGFKGVGIRRGYYSDTGEDGILMALENLASGHFRTRLEWLRQAHSQRRGIRNYRIAR